MPDIPPTDPTEGGSVQRPLSPPTASSSSFAFAPVPQLPCTDFNPDGPSEFDAEMSLPRGAGLPVIKFAPLPTLWKLETFVSYDDDDDDEHKQIRFVRPKQELQERPGQTLYAVDNEDSDKSIPIEEPLKKMKTEGWGAHMFPQDKWKCDTCLGHNDLNFSKCSACEAARPGHEATTVAMTELE